MVVFEDDTFTADTQRAREIASLLIERDLRMPWFANLRVTTDAETLRLMHDAGLQSCAAGFESGSQELLDAAGKGITLDQSRRFMRDCRCLGIHVHGCFMVGFPGETESTMAQTLDFALELDCDSAQFYPVFLYPGTEAYAWAKENGYLRDVPFSAWLDDAGRHACVYDLPGLPAERMTAFCEKANRRFHLRPSYLLRKMLRSLRSPDEARMFARSGWNYLQYLLGTGRAS